MRTVVFEGNALETIRKFPADARNQAGYEIDRVQRGLEPVNWKPFTSIGQGVRELRIQTGNQYRVIYIAKYEKKIHILHAFQKKTRKTRAADIDLAKSRLKAVLKRYR